MSVEQKLLRCVVCGNEWIGLWDMGSDLQTAAVKEWPKCGWLEARQSFGTNSREQAERIERDNLAYFAGYYDDQTRQRVETLFKCAHPVFGSIAENGPPTTKQAFQMGVAMGAAAKLVKKQAADGSLH